MSQIVLNEKLLSNKKKLEVLKNPDLSKIIDSYLKCRLCHRLSNTNDKLIGGMCQDCVDRLIDSNYGGFNIRYKF